MPGSHGSSGLDLKPSPDPGSTVTPRAAARGNGGGVRNQGFSMRMGSQSAPAFIKLHLASAEIINSSIWRLLRERH